jgi:hypothetical protein
VTRANLANGESQSKAFQTELPRFLHPNPVGLLALYFRAAREAVTKGFEEAQLSVGYPPQKGSERFLAVKAAMACPTLQELDFHCLPSAYFGQMSAHASRKAQKI